MSRKRRRLPFASIAMPCGVEPSGTGAADAWCDKALRPRALLEDVKRVRCALRLDPEISVRSIARVKTNCTASRIGKRRIGRVERSASWACMSY